ncbi:MAG: hypothetical protein A2901_00380 [Elusimicrobia bacterium RIFCSPLOWO2_01_FULL_54_10]|nr:MAG: hypothetical protein A2901_00380 [Elusimicrobia bacterium RIFCSPLOWO2_01_FULL_54_10]
MIPNEYAVSIQVYSTVIVAIATVIYAALTYRLLHAPFRGFARPTEVFLEQGQWAIRVENFGSNVVLDVVLETVMVINLEPDQKRDGIVWITKDIVKAEGPFEIKGGNNATYVFKYLTDFKSPFFLKWKTLSGNYQKTVWKITVDHPEDKIQHLGIIEGIIFRVKWGLRSWFLTPFKRLYKWHQTK